MATSSWTAGLSCLYVTANREWSASSSICRVEPLSSKLLIALSDCALTLRQLLCLRSCKHTRKVRLCTFTIDPFSFNIKIAAQACPGQDPVPVLESGGACIRVLGNASNKVAGGQSDDKRVWLRAATGGLVCPIDSKLRVAVNATRDEDPDHWCSFIFDDVDTTG